MVGLIRMGFLIVSLLAVAIVARVHAETSISESTTDKDGFLIHTVRSPYQAGATEIRVLLPETFEAAQKYRVVYILPVEAGREEHWGDGLRELKKSGLHNRLGLIGVSPTFAHLPWYCDHPDDAAIRQETYFLNVVVPFVERQYPALNQRNGRWLVGFSKSGWGAWSLLLRHPERFAKAAAWDAPLMMQQPDKYGMQPIFGTQENFTRYQISALLAAADSTLLHSPPRLLLLGHGNFRDQHQQTHALLERLKIPHVYRDGPARPHHWNSGWLTEAMELLAAQPSAETSAAMPPPKLPRAEPADVGMSPTRLAVIDEIVNEGLSGGRMPGCVIAIGCRGQLVFLKAYGHKQLEPDRVAMTTDTVFDLASLTKPIATATSIMLLAEQGKLSLDDPVAKHLPEFAQHDKDGVTIRHLLTHQGGLIADNALADYQGEPRESLRRIFALRLQSEPGSKFVYSDVGFIVLGEIVRSVSHRDVHEFSRDAVFQPLGMTDTGFLPAETLRQRAAPTERRNDRWMQGEVHDPRAHRLGGIAGHAGLFSTAEDLAVYAQMLLAGGEYHGRRILQPTTITTMTNDYPVPSGVRGLGWDKRSAYSSNRGDLMTHRAFGHGGFTGTALWIDPGHDLFVIFLSNRVHPNGQGQVNTLIGRIGTIATAAAREPAPPSVK